MPIKEAVKNISYDASWLLAMVIAWLPVIQGVLSILITLVILLIQIRRYKKLKEKSNEEEKTKIL